MHKIVFLLKTYIGDINYVERLMPSFKKFNVDKIPLYIVVPEDDLGSFKKFEGRGIKLLTDESVTDDLVFDHSVRGIRPGYINQEIIKLSFWKKGFCKNYFCLDSDAVFIRKFYISDFMYNKEIPYTIFDEDNELLVDPEYYKKYGRSRQKLLRRIQYELLLRDKRFLTCHAFAIFSCKVLESFYRNYLLRNRLSYKDILKISPYEFSWYNMWLQKDKTIPIEFREPLIKMFHQKSQHVAYLHQGIRIKDMARGYIGYNINSNYSRDFGVISYDTKYPYLPTLKMLLTFSQRSVKRLFHFG